MKQDLSVKILEHSQASGLEKAIHDLIDAEDCYVRDIQYSTSIKNNQPYHFAMISFEEDEDE